MVKKTQEAVKRDSEARQKMIQGLAEFEIAVATEAGEDMSARPVMSRHDVPCPFVEPHPIYNPDGVVDVVTFCEHPHFLDLKLTPWQKIIVKSFYMGSEGSTKLKIENDRSDTGCNGCVWKNNMLAESETARHGKSRLPMMLAANSPCLKCERFPQQDREDRYEQLSLRSLNERGRENVEKLKARPVEDGYITEWGVLHDPQVNSEMVQQVEDKIGNKFQELILVLGRRSGKSFMVSIIALYETYRFLMMQHPQPRFSMMDYDTITICNVANSKSQAQAAIFDKIAQLVLASPFFGKYVGKKTQSEIHFKTPQDILENERRALNGDEPLTGTIQLISGHSNSTTLVGRSMAVIILDEMAEMAGASDDGTDSDLYAKLKPSIATFGLEGKIICISNPLGPSGKFYKLYLASFLDETTLMFQLPSWLSNPTIDQRLLDSERLKDPANFSMHYGAEFGDAGAQPFLPPELVHNAFLRGDKIRRAEFGTPKNRYFAHLDPAYNFDNYTLVVLHTEAIFGMTDTDGRPLMRVVVDHVNIWTPKGPNHPVPVEEVDAYVLALASKFKFAQISYDHWQSQGSINKLKSHGLNVICTTFNRDYQDRIFQTMFDLFISERIDIYNVNTRKVVDGTNSFESDWEGLVSLRDVDQSKEQLLMLQRVLKGNRYKIEAIPGKRDDVPDCIASAAYQALKDKVYVRMPLTRSAYLGDRFR
jgi:hypothetical protein